MCMIGERLREWSPLAEWWYNTTYHSYIHISPYEAVYGQPLLLHLPCFAAESLVATVDRSLQARGAALKMLKYYLRRAQEKMKVMAHNKKIEREFQIGDWVYLKLQPYRQQTICNWSCLKLAARYFRPFQVLERIGKVANKLQLPPGSQVHSVFHVSQPKQHVGNQPAQAQLPVLGMDGTIVKEPNVFEILRGIPKFQEGGKLHVLSGHSSALCLSTDAKSQTCL
ncbi:uncharacterized protein LOC111280634 [Durio zibethinus]|uniref:Uncharacterized protein LOC111280634 n=1 Tax=Durio zibethinus TaxID=66656 RepID=A0A6P5X5Y8_DURZI|nr:uncharacterized protein LOC111280634 [Durio zibethinus]